MTRVTGDWLTGEATQRLLKAFEASGHQIFFVGGCVRNALLGVPVSDLDLATSARPDEIMALAQAQGIKAIGTGLDHGTVTLVTGGLPHEVTSFRADRETDGRHAVVQFGTDPAQDAKRRDFTMNGLYADREGNVQDWVEGIQDATARRVRFIGDPATRIAEDYLRILRFFRFHAWYGDAQGGIDAEGLAACASGQDGLAQLSAERIGSEMRKLLSAPDPAPAIAAMAQSGILARVLPGSDDRLLAPLVHLEGARAKRWARRAAILGGDDPSEIWRLSRKQSRKLGTLRAKMATSESTTALGYAHGAELAVDIALCRAALFETPPASDFEHQAKRGAEAVFPIKAADLPALQGPALGAKLKELEAAWIASDFRASREDLLS